MSFLGTVQYLWYGSASNGLEPGFPSGVWRIAAGNCQSGLGRSHEAFPEAVPVMNLCVAVINGVAVLAFLDRSEWLLQPSGAMLHQIVRDRERLARMITGVSAVFPETDTFSSERM